jgi:hypothetical protein
MRTSGLVGVSACVAIVLLSAMSCSESRPVSPAGPSAIGPEASALASESSPPKLYPSVAFFDTRSGPMAVTFPPRNEPVNFKLQLEAKYRDQLQRSAGSTFVDPEGDIVWTTEYLLYRLNLCGHADAVAKVMRQIDTGQFQGLCGTAPTGTIPFPPRNEPADFRNQLEAKYRDGLRRPPSSTFVDLEGDVVWITEYTRFRVNGCGHDEAVQKVFRIIDGAGDQPLCTSPVNITAVINGPTGVVNVRSTVALSGLNSSSSRGPIVSYQWRCSNTQTTDCSASVPTPQFQYLKSGPLGTTVNHTVTLTVRDSEGNSATTTFTVRVSQNY